MLKKAMIPPDDLDIVGGLYELCDPAYSTKKRSDSSAFIVCGFNKDGHLIVKLANKEKMDSKDVVETLFSLQRQWRPRVVGVEANSTQMLLMTYIKEMRKQRGLFFKITEIKTGTKSSKVDRIRKLVPYFKEGKIFIPEEFEDLYDELKSFPKGHDDLLDALSFIENVKRPPTEPQNLTWEPRDEYFSNFGYSPFGTVPKGARM
jgi:predicted phage terminase large subunit-like protein